MPWCPHCKKEYPDTVTFCDDCVTNLVDVLPDTKEYIPFFQGEKRSIAEKLAKYFEHSNLETKIHYDEEKDFYILSIPAGSEADAKKYYQAFYFEERARIEAEEKNMDSIKDIDESNIVPEHSYTAADLEISENAGFDVEEEVAAAKTDTPPPDSNPDTTQRFDSGQVQEDASPDNPADESDSKPLEENTEDESEDTDDEPKPSSLRAFMTGSGSYVMKSEKYKDYAGTLYIFLILGIAGIVFVILNIAGVLTLLNGFFPNLIMGALFLFFIYEALSTGKKAKKLKLEIEEENKLTHKINEWLTHNITEEFLTSISNPDISDELDYMKKADTIREMLMKEFGEQNPDYLDRLIEEFYSEVIDK